MFICLGVLLNSLVSCSFRFFLCSVLKVRIFGFDFCGVFICIYIYLIRVIFKDLIKLGIMIVTFIYYYLCKYNGKYLYVG